MHAATVGAAEALADAWRESALHDLTLAEARTRTESARFHAESTRALRRPTVSFSGLYTQLSSPPAVQLPPLGILALPSIDFANRFGFADVRANWPVYTAGRIGQAISAADRRTDARLAEEKRITSDIRLSVAEAFIDVLRAQRATAVADSSVATLSAHVKDVRNLFAQGVVPRNDVLAVEVEYANAEQRRLQAQNALDLARAAYNRLLGRPLDAEVDLDERLPALKPALINEPLENLTARALAQRSELNALTAQSAALEHLAASTRANLLPQVILSAGYTYAGFDVLEERDFLNASLGFTWSFFGGAARNRANALLRESRATNQQQEHVRSLIELQVRQAWLNVKETEQRVRVTESAVAQAEEDLRLARNRYLQGLGTNAQVLDAQTRRVLTLSNRDNARFDAELAKLRLLRAMEEL
ncbi:MAG TPA: TolC family protein [Steroidobacteraceae bacterium]